MKLSKFFGLLALAGMALTACNTDDNDDVTPQTPSSNDSGVTKDSTDAFPDKVYVVATGNEGYTINSALSLYDVNAGTVTADLFSTASGRSLGMTANDMVTYGTEGYIAVTSSNTIEIVSLPTGESIKQISLAGKEYSGPRRMTKVSSYIYVTMKSGHLVRIDTKTKEIDKVVAFTPLEGSTMGTYPEGLDIINRNVYVALSGQGDQIENRVAVVDALSMEFKQYITVATNLTDILVADNRLFALSSGWYDANNGWVQQDAGLYEFDDNGPKGLKCAATMATTNGGRNIYYINAPYGASTTSLGVYYVRSATSRMLATPAPGDSPVALGLSNTDYLLIGSNQLGDGGYPSYELPCYIMRYNISEGETTKINTNLYGINRFVR